MSEDDLFGIPDDFNPEDGGDADFDESKWALLLADLLRVFEALFKRRGMDDRTAFDLARETALTEAEYFGGRQWYLPKGERLRLALRDAEIWRRFNGRNVPELAREYDVSTIHLYAILRKQRALNQTKLQGRLFPD